jgi:hypothetical protein
MSARFAVIAIAAAACGGPIRATRASDGGATAATAVTLYRDTAEVRERRRVVLDGAGRGRVAIAIDAAIGDEAIDARATGARIAGVAIGAGGSATVSVTGSPHAAADVTVVYATSRLGWSAAYTAIRDRDRGDARLDGALAVDNRTGVEFPAAMLVVVDGDRAQHAKDAALDVGVVAIERGASRIGLGDPRPSTVRDVAVFDATGNVFDSPGSMPQRQRDYGLGGKPKTEVERGYEVRLVAPVALPAGSLRLYDRGRGGELISLGAGGLDGSAATIATGVARDVTARRRRTEYFLDEYGKRLIEEFTIAIDNRGAHPIDVVVREHLYRGTNWQIAYSTVALYESDQEGEQLVAMRAIAAPKRETILLYRVVYWWK